MSLAIFIQPEGELNSEIIYWKNKINNKIINQPYVNHPPHMTLLHFESINENNALGIFSNLSNKFSQFKIDINETNIFWDDLITNGHTFYFNVKKNNNLYKIQKFIAEKFKDNKKNINPPLYLKKNKERDKIFL